MTDREKRMHLNDGSVLIRTEEGIYFHQIGEIPILDDPAHVADTLLAELERGREENRKLKEENQRIYQNYSKRCEKYKGLEWENQRLRKKNEKLIEGLRTIIEESNWGDVENANEKVRRIARDILKEIGVTLNNHRE